MNHKCDDREKIKGSWADFLDQTSKEENKELVEKSKSKMRGAF